MDPHIVPQFANAPRAASKIAYYDQSLSALRLGNEESLPWAILTLIGTIYDVDVLFRLWEIIAVDTVD